MANSRFRASRISSALCAPIVITSRGVGRQLPFMRPFPPSGGLPRQPGRKPLPGGLPAGQSAFPSISRPFSPCFTAPFPVFASMVSRSETAVNAKTKLLLAYRGGRCPVLLSDCRKTSCEGVPRRVPAAAAAGIKSKSVISGDMCLGNDTSHGGRGDFFARKRTPSAMQPFSKKRLCRFFDTLSGVVLYCAAGPPLPALSSAGPGTPRRSPPAPRRRGRRSRSGTAPGPGCARPPGSPRRRRR